MPNVIPPPFGKHYGATTEDLHQAIRLHDIQRVDKIVKSGMDVNASLRSTTALSLAVYLGKDDIVSLLLQHGASIDKLSCDPMARVETPLFSACRLGKTSIVRKLIQGGADLDKADFYNHTPVWINAREKRTDMLQMLVLNGAKLNISDHWNQCPLYLAAKFSGRLAIATLLIYHGCRVDIVDNRGHSAVYWAIQNCDKDLIRLLIHAGAKVFKTWLSESAIPLELLEDDEFAGWLYEEVWTPSPLQRQCRTLIRRHLHNVSGGCSIVDKVERLGLPVRLKDCLLLTSTAI